MATTKKTYVWVLTREHNEYDQYGEYFEAVFSKQPSLEELANFFNERDLETHTLGLMDTVSFLENLRKGGGRRKAEDVWYNLEKVEIL